MGTLVLLLLMLAVGSFVWFSWLSPEARTINWIRSTGRELRKKRERAERARGGRTRLQASLYGPQTEEVLVDPVIGKQVTLSGVVDGVDVNGKVTCIRESADPKHCLRIEFTLSIPEAATLRPRQSLRVTGLIDDRGFNPEYERFYAIRLRRPSIKT